METTWTEKIKSCFDLADELKIDIFEYEDDDGEYKVAEVTLYEYGDGPGELTELDTFCFPAHESSTVGYWHISIVDNLFVRTMAFVPEGAKIKFRGIETEHPNSFLKQLLALVEVNGKEMGIYLDLVRTTK